MTDIVKQENQPLARIEPSITEIIQQAVASGRPASELTELLNFARELRKDDAERAFNVAFAKFKAECPPVVRKTKDEYITVLRNGTRRPRTYASLHDISATVDGPLQKNGLTYDWGDAVMTEDGCIVRKFILRHEAGHSRSTSSPPIPIEGTDAYRKIDKDRKATSASPQQRMGVADTYAMRYAMISGLGLTSCDDDDESLMHGQNAEAVTADQARQLNDALIDVQANVPAFLGLYKIAKLADLPASKFDEAWARIQDKKSKLGVKK